MELYYCSSIYPYGVRSIFESPLRSEQSVRTATSQQRSSNRDSSGIIPDRKPTTLNITKGITPEKK
jgi:hypothetical protein